jgi:tetraacyldisaccharide 4'-kinase
VPVKAPSWWYRESPAATASLLRPAGALAAWATRMRFRYARPYRSRLPVLCVGNFTVGGTGKTPLVMLVCELLINKGERPAVLTRGFGGHLKGPHWVDGSKDRGYDVGDEPLLLAKSAPVLVARDRQAGAIAIERGLGLASVIVMDDGLQNPHIEKDMALAVVDGVRGLGNGLVLPAGPLRATLDFQLTLVEAIVINAPADTEKSDAAAEELRWRFPGPVLRAQLSPREDARWLAGARVVAFAGIGAPERFFTTLRGLGAVITEALTFADHHVYRAADAERLLDLAHRLDAMLVTTEKDLARLAGANGAPGQLAAASRALPVRLGFAERDLTRLEALIDMGLGKSRT